MSVKAMLAAMMLWLAPPPAEQSSLSPWLVTGIAGGALVTAVATVLTVVLSQPRTFVGTCGCPPPSPPSR
jgi:hypothetical protein